MPGVAGHCLRWLCAVPGRAGAPHRAWLRHAVRANRAALRRAAHCPCCIGMVPPAEPDASPEMKRGEDIREQNLWKVRWSLRLAKQYFKVFFLFLSSVLTSWRFSSPNTFERHGGAAPAAHERGPLPSDLRRQAAWRGVDRLMLRARPGPAAP